MFSRPPQGPDAMPPDPTGDTDMTAQAATVAGITSLCVSMREQHGPLFDAADGMRADLLGRGWSQQMADALVFTWTQRNLICLTPIPGEGGSE